MFYDPQWCFLWASTDFLCFAFLIGVAACHNVYTVIYILFLKAIAEFIHHDHFLYTCVVLLISYLSLSLRLYVPSFLCFEH